jgi:hypothetical protein
LLGALVVGNVTRGHFTGGDFTTGIFTGAGTGLLASRIQLSGAEHNLKTFVAAI